MTDEQAIFGPDSARQLQRVRLDYRRFAQSPMVDDDCSPALPLFHSPSMRLEIGFDLGAFHGQCQRCLPIRARLIDVRAVLHQ